MDASIVLAVLVGVWALYFVVSSFVPPSECPVLVSISAAFRADRRADLIEEIRLTAKDRDAAYKAALAMAESGELNHLDAETVEKHARHLRQFNALADRVVELYGQLDNCQ